MSNAEAAGQRSRWSRLVAVRREDLPLLLAYAVLFYLAHGLAAWWGGPGFYSLWFPAAGIRFALLWAFGARLTLAVVAVELGVQLLSGVLRIGAADWIPMAISIARPALAYGLAIAAVRYLTRQRRSPLSTPPMPFGFAAVLAPVSAAMAALPWSLAKPELTGVEGARDVVASLSSFATGDLLGVLLVAPPLIYVAALWRGKSRPAWRWPHMPSLIEGSAVFAVGLLIVLLLASLRIGYSGMPLLLAACWIGLRFGRTAAWLTNVAVAALVFPLTSGVTDIDSKLDLHMSLAAVAVAGYVAASFAAATQRSRVEIARRDRLLLHADRLKTLRAMSVAVIHEVSQPLSTLVLETRHLRQQAERGEDPELLETARLVERKTGALAEMTRRLRDFGSRGAAEAEPVDVEHCLKEALTLLKHESRGAQVRVTVSPGSGGARVRANRVELTQALLNLLRNGVQATAHGEVAVSLASEGAEVVLRFANPVHSSLPPGGMGVGSIIARAIMEAAGGQMRQLMDEGTGMTVEVNLPLEAANAG